MSVQSHNHRSYTGSKLHVFVLRNNSYIAMLHQGGDEVVAAVFSLLLWSFDDERHFSTKAVSLPFSSPSADSSLCTVWHERSLLSSAAGWDVCGRSKVKPRTVLMPCLSEGNAT